MSEEAYLNLYINSITDVDTDNKKSKISDIESNPEKCNVRVDLQTQVAQFSNANPQITEMDVMTLCGVSWPFEHGLMKLASKMCENPPTFKFVGTDNTAKDTKEEFPIAVRALREMPPNATMFNDDIFDVMTCKAFVNAGGIGKVIKGELEDRIVHILWLDFCCQPKVELIEKIVSLFKNVPYGLLYITFSIKVRKGGGGGLDRLLSDCKVPRNIRGDEPTKLIKHIMNRAKKIGTKKITPICNIMYRGGGAGSTDMFTFGYALGCDASGIDPIEYDARENESRAKARHTCSTAKSKVRNGEDPFDIIRVPKAKPVRVGKDTRPKPTPEQKVKVKEYLSKGWDNEKIAKKLDIRLGSVGSMAAHINHPEKFKEAQKKRVAK